MTTAEMLRREGRDEGRQEGEVLGKRAALLLQLRQRFGRLPAVAVARVEKAAATELDVWFGRVLAATSLDDVLGAPVAVPSKKAMPPKARARRGARRG